MTRLYRFFFIFFCVLILSSSPAFGSGGDAGSAGSSTLELEIQTGPAFHQNDADEISYCTQEIFWNFFPMDFLFNGASLPSSSQCPVIEFFTYEHEMCFLLDAYTNFVSPAFQLSMLIYAIFHL